MKPRILLAALIVAVVLPVVLVAASLAAVWLDGGVRFFEWGAAIGPLCLLVGAYSVSVVIWSMAFERNKAIAEFGDREGGKR